MATVVSFNSPSEVLTYLNANTQTGTVEEDWFVIDKGSQYVVIEEAPFLVTTLKSEAALKAHLEALAGTFKTVIPHGAGGKFTFVSLANETGTVNTHTMVITRDVSELETALNDAGVNTAIFENKNFTLVLKD